MLEIEPIAWFERNCSAYIEKMQNCSYESRHHMEGDVWTHTRLCYARAVEYDANEYVRWACLLHDLGRLMTRKEVDGEVQFGDYEPVSMAMALDILPYAGLDGAQMVRILKIIANHYEVMNHIKFNKPTFEKLVARYRHEEILLKDLAIYARCDMNAREVHPSRQHLYRDEAIVAFQQRVAGITQTPHQPRSLSQQLTLLVGVPCSGKSTFISQMPRDNRHLLVSRDQYTLEVGALHGHDNYDDSFKARQKTPVMQQQTKILDEAYETLAEHHPYDVTIDNPNLKASTRRDWITCKRDTHRIRVVVFLKSIGRLFACEREGKTRTVSNASIVSRLKEFQLPLPSDGIDELVFMIHGPDPRKLKGPPPPPTLEPR